MAKFKCEVVRCTDEEGNCKAATYFGVDESKFNCGGNKRQ
jgi:hypothetical protein